jgi:hypothetical protein
MGNIIKKEMTAVDNFDGWDDTVEGVDRPEGAGVIQGTLLKFSNEAKWVTRDDDEMPSDLELIIVDVIRVVQRWQDGSPIETRILQPGEKFPDVDALNEAVPRDEWIEGPDGQLRGPHQAQSIVYMLDPSTMDRYSYPTGTVGGRIAIRELVDKTTWIRRMRGDNVYAVVTLGDCFMKTRFGGRQRPHFQNVRWTRLGGDNSNVEALPPPPSTPTPQVAAPPLVQEPSVAEELNDPLPDDLAPPKPAKKTSVKQRAPNLLEAG